MASPSEEGDTQVASQEDGAQAASEEPFPPGPVQCEEAFVGGACEVVHLSSDGRQLLASGEDGRFVAADASAKPPARLWTQRLASQGASLSAVAVSSDRAWLATGQPTDNVFGVFVCPLDRADGRPSALSKGGSRRICRATLPIRELCWHPSQPLLGIATDDGKLCVWECADDAASGGNPAAKRKPLREFRVGDVGGVRCLAFDPLGDFLAAASTSGALIVFRLDNTAKPVSCTNLWSKAVIGRERLAMAWHPDGSVLALAGEPTVRLVARGDFGKPAVSLEGGHRQSTSAAAWNASGELLATASCDAVAFWRPQGGTALRVVRLDAQPRSLCWGGEFLAVGTLAGSWARIVAPGEEVAAAGAPGQSPSSAAAAGEAEEEATAADLDDFLEEPLDTAEEEDEPRAAAKDGAKDAPRAEPLIQQTFQPGATTAQKGERRRYLAWSEHGALKLLLPVAADKGGRRRAPAPVATAGRVEVEYSRERGRAGVRELRAPPGLAMGALGPGLCALATDPVGHAPAKVAVHLATPWQRPLFEHALPEGERVEALAVGRGFFAAATSPGRLLRVQTAAGLPLGLMTTPGDVVCLAACEDLLLCVTRQPGAPSAEPVLDFVLYGVAEREQLAAGRLPLSAASTLRWAGFGAEAQPLALDSAGVLHMLALGGAGAPVFAPASGEWLPVAELDGGGARLWPVRAEGGILYCAEVARAGEEPRVGAVQRLREVRFGLPFGVECEAPMRVLREGLLASQLAFALEAGLLPAQTKRRLERKTPAGRARCSDEGRQALKLFEELAKSGEVEQAADVARKYFALQAGTAQEEAQLLEHALKLARKASRERLANDLDELLTEAQARLQGAPQEVDDEASASGSDDGGDEEPQPGLLKRRCEGVAEHEHPALRMKVA